MCHVSKCHVFFENPQEMDIWRRAPPPIRLRREAFENGGQSYVPEIKKAYNFAHLMIFSEILSMCGQSHLTPECERKN